MGVIQLLCPVELQVSQLAPRRIALPEAARLLASSFIFSKPACPDDVSVMLVTLCELRSVTYHGVV